ncbi:ABC transporter substrate-binding protein [Marinobacterium arenosum]|uniref:ABC transporter substrate-binding protein n=1 Tax=Marinobacterium arenosum TaxID=2862496 RepID=UPI001C942A1F|nr:ABC transporter substrate-binding protein [Marinobacterium arenosum]MBY4678427.1 ABC transporter substrate-binding protein [Marinobacterium arenosum]
MRSGPIKTLAAAGLLFSAFTPNAQAACELDRPIRIAGMSWLSNQITVNIQQQILEKGYQCRTEQVVGGTLPMITATIRGDVDVMNEIWPNSVAEAWKRAKEQGKVKDLASIYSGGVEGWFIPSYVAEANPDLKSVYDLAKYKELFRDAEEPGKGRFYTCPAGWSCEVANQNLMKAFELESDYVLFSAGSGAALEAAIISEYKRQRPVLFYYWGPSPLLGRYQFTQLQMPAYDPKGHECNISADCEQPAASGFPVSDIINGANSEFVEQAPQLTRFFSAFNIPTEKFNGVLGWAAENEAEPDQAASHFLKTRADLWRQWVPADVAERIQQQL